MHTITASTRKEGMIHTVWKTELRMYYSDKYINSYVLEE